MKFGKILSSLWLIGFLLSVALGVGPRGERLDKQVGQPVDIAPSAYQYRSDRRPDTNPPESWLALMHFANLPLNKPVDRTNSDIRRCLAGILWEEIRPVQTLELTWPPASRRQPPPDKVAISALVNRGASSSWWNNLDSAAVDSKPTVSNGGRTYTYAIGRNTCGLVVAVSGLQNATQFDVPQVRVLAPDTWKAMDVEIEWGFDKAAADRDYSGHIDTYDGRLADVRPLDGDSRTTLTKNESWSSIGRAAPRRGIKMSLLYMGTSKWRKQQSYTTHPDDVARTIVTIWTKSGNFSFLAADLERF